MRQMAYRSGWRSSPISVAWLGVFGGERPCENKVPCPRRQCPRPGLEPGPLDPEASTLTMRLTRLRASTPPPPSKNLKFISTGSFIYTFLEVSLHIHILYLFLLQDCVTTGSSALNSKCGKWAFERPNRLDDCAWGTISSEQLACCKTGTCNGFQNTVGSTTTGIRTLRELGLHVFPSKLRGQSSV